MTNVLHYIVNSIPYMLCAVPVWILIRIIVNSLRKTRKINWYHEIGLLFFTMYCAGVASQTVIPKLEFGGSGMIVNSNLSGEINPIPGMVFADIYKECIQNGHWLYFVINFAGNICLFLPIGFGLPLLWNNMSAKKTALIALGASLFIEIGQLPQARGTDIDDLWLNVLGAAVGYLLYRLIIKIEKVNLLCCKFKQKT